MSSLTILVDYQTTKHNYLKTAKIPQGSKYSQVDLDRGFNVSGLWSWSRHPNFACEQTIWIVFYQWGAFASQSPLNWTVAGAIGLVGIFTASTWLTELITAKKYPQYKEYQRLVSKFFPGFLGGVRGVREKQN
jgi:steroid 5-alpha reductase family enzyme